MLDVIITILWCYCLLCSTLPKQLPQKLDECNNEGDIPLNLALLNRHEGIANTLVSHKCDLDIQDPDGNSLLHLAILRGDSFAASFLIRNGASTILARRVSQETPIHMVATYNPSQVCGCVPWHVVKMARWLNGFISLIHNFFCCCFCIMLCM